MTPIPTTGTLAAMTPAHVAGARARGLDASHRARRNEEGYGLRPWYLFCSVEDFLIHLESVEAERKAAKANE